MNFFFVIFYRSLAEALPQPKSSRKRWNISGRNLVRGKVEESVLPIKVFKVAERLKALFH